MPTAQLKLKNLSRKVIPVPLTPIEEIENSKIEKAFKGVRNEIPFQTPEGLGNTFPT